MGTIPILLMIVRQQVIDYCRIITGIMHFLNNCNHRYHRLHHTILQRWISEIMTILFGRWKLHRLQYKHHLILLSSHKRLSSHFIPVCMAWLPIRWQQEGPTWFHQIYTTQEVNYLNAAFGHVIRFSKAFVIVYSNSTSIDFDFNDHTAKTW